MHAVETLEKLNQQAVTTWLINKAAVKRVLLEQAKKTRHQPFERVSEGVYIHLNNVNRELCNRIVESQPSKGKTIKV